MNTRQRLKEVEKIQKKVLTFAKRCDIITKRSGVGHEQNELREHMNLEN